MTRTSTRIITLTNQNTSCQSRDIVFQSCMYCKKQLTVGDEIVSKNGQRRKWYHLKCAKKVNII